MQYKQLYFIRYLHHNYQQLSYFWVVVLVIVMIAAIKEFINYATIEQNTQSEVMQQNYWTDKIAFEENFLIPYLSSSSAEYFFQHENSILWPNEYVVVFVEDNPQDSPTLLSTPDTDSSDPSNIPVQKSWQQFVDELIQKTQ